VAIIEGVFEVEKKEKSIHEPWMEVYSYCNFIECHFIS